MSSTLCSSSSDKAASMSPSDKRNTGGFHLSSLSEISRNATSPWLCISSRIPVTMSRTFLASTLDCSGVRPALRCRGMAALLLEHSPWDEASLAAGGHGLRHFRFPRRPTMLLGGVSRFVVRLDRFRCARQHGEVPPANDFRGGHRNIPRDRHLDHRGCLGIQRSLNTGAYVLRRFRFGGDFEAKGLRQCNEIHGIGSPVAGLVELRPDLPAHEVILAVANRNVAGVIEDEESNRNAVHRADGQLLHTHHEVAVADDAYDRRIRLSQFGADGRRKCKAHGRK